MRDGVELSARLYRPAGISAAVPTILHLTPYISSRIHERAQIFNDMGFAVLSVDCRGRAESGGEFTCEGPQVGRDGADLIGWIRTQDWSSGEVFTRGGSAIGNIQWQILGENPEGLIAAAPFAAAKPGYDSEPVNNILRLDYITWLAHVSGRTENNEIYSDDDYWVDVFRTAYREHWSLEQLAGSLGPDLELYDKCSPLIDPPGFGPYWESLDLRPDQYAGITQPILSMTGYYDGNQPGTLFRHAMHMAHGRPDAIASHFLVIGPWGHAEVMRASRDVCGHRFGPASLVARDELHRDFFNWARGQGLKPDFLKGNVGWYVMGAEEWRWVDRIEDIATGRMTFALASEGNAGEAGSGHLADSPNGPPDIFRCDPFDMRLIDEQVIELPDYIVSDDLVRLAGGNGVVYESASFQDSAEIAGIPAATLWLESDAPDFDLHLTLHEVFADGSVFFLTECMWRARWRHSLAHEQMMPLGTPEECIIDRFYFFARRIASGSRLRLTMKHLNSIAMQRNYNGGGRITDERPEDGRVATIRVHHDARHPSRLELPVTLPV